MNREELRRENARNMTEQELEDNIVDMLDTFGFWYHHDRPARTGRIDGNGKEVWRNHFRGQAGIPDFYICGNRELWAELKTESGQLRPEQRAWFDRLLGAGVEVYVWRPSDWLDGSIGELLLGAKP